MSKAFSEKSIQRAWVSYDLANSVYNLVITATIFPIYYNLMSTIKNEQGAVIHDTIDVMGYAVKNTALYDWVIALAYLIVAFLSPLLSGIADYGGNKKSFMRFFTYLGSMACVSMYFFTADRIWFGLFMALLACIGFAGSLVFYNAFLPEIADKHEQDKLSARGFAMGYWGSSILLMICLALVMTRSSAEEKISMMRIAFLLCGLWWFGFSHFAFHFLPGHTASNPQPKKRLLKGFQEIRSVARQLRNQKNLLRFLPSFFIYSMGVQTVMLVANHFGSKEIGMEPGELITTILIIQFVAMAGAFVFAYCSKKLGNIPTLKIATIIWAIICAATYLFVFTSQHFYVVAAFVGLVMGGIQSLSRSTYSKLLPATEDHASYFSFYDVCEKLSIVLGMLVFGLLNQGSDSMRTPILALILFFVAGFLLLQRVRMSDGKEVSDVNNTHL